MRNPIEERIRVVVEDLAAEVRVPPSFAPAAVRRGRRLRRRRRAGTGVAALALVVALGLTWSVAMRPGPRVGPPVVATSASAPDPVRHPTPIAIPGSQVRIVDSPNGDRSEHRGAALTVDGDHSTGWSTYAYNTRDFGHLKPGMGILVDLGERRSVQGVRVRASVPGAVLQVRTGSADPGDNAAGDTEILNSFAGLPDEAAVRMVADQQLFTGFDPDRRYRYLLVWISELPLVGRSTYRVAVQEIEVLAP